MIKFSGIVLSCEKGALSGLPKINILWGRKELQIESGDVDFSLTLSTHVVCADKSSHACVSISLFGGGEFNLLPLVIQRNAARDRKHNACYSSLQNWKPLTVPCSTTPGPCQTLFCSWRGDWRDWPSQCCQSLPPCQPRLCYQETPAFANLWITELIKLLDNSILITYYQPGIVSLCGRRCKTNYYDPRWWFHQLLYYKETVLENPTGR